MTAMIRPVSIQYTDFCHGRITFFFVFIIILNVKEIFKGHSKIQRSIQFFKLIFWHISKAFKNLYIFWFLKICHQCFRFFCFCFSGIYWVDAMCFDRFQLFKRNISFNHVCSCRADDRILILF